MIAMESPNTENESISLIDIDIDDDDDDDNYNSNDVTTDLSNDNDIETERVPRTRNAQSNEIKKLSFSAVRASILKQETEIAAMLKDASIHLKFPTIKIGSNDTSNASSTTLATLSTTDFFTEESSRSMDLEDVLQEVDEAARIIESTRNATPQTSQTILSSAVFASPAAGSAASAVFKVPTMPGKVAKSNSVGGSGSAGGSCSNSLKKRRTKNRKRNGSETRNSQDRSGGDGDVAAPVPPDSRRRRLDNCCANNLPSSSKGTAVTSNIKTSLSMTSLPPDEKAESRDVIKAKLNIERPYNSLKRSINID